VTVKKATSLMAKAFSSLLDFHPRHPIPSAIQNINCRIGRRMESDMPTGYTYPVVDGKVTEFPEFALSCARAFGALIMMRDAPLAAEIPDEFEPSDYSAKKLVEAKAKLKKLHSLSPAQVQHKADESYAIQLKAHLDYRARMRLENDRLDTMLKQVRSWRPPTSEHKGLKEFMIEQLTSSKHDMKWGSEEPVKQSAQAWLAREIASAEREVAYHTQEDEKEKERTTGRTEWVRQLRASLKASEPA
jgi:hypothetical protein